MFFVGWTFGIQNLNRTYCSLNGRSLKFRIIWARFRNWPYSLRVFAGGRLNLRTSDLIWIGIWTFVRLHQLTLGLERTLVEVKLIFTTWKLFLCYVCFEFCTWKLLLLVQGSILGLVIFSRTMFSVLDIRTWGEY